MFKNKYEYIEKEQLKKYAELAVYKGINVQKGQLVVIQCEIEDAIFARLIQTVAYDAGASNVVVDWSDGQTEQLFYQHATDEWMDHAPDWLATRYEEWDNKGAAYLIIESENPGLLAESLSEKKLRYGKSLMTKVKEHSLKTRSYEQRWSILDVPNLNWAKKVFPELSEEVALSFLWQAILKGARADGENPTKDWEAHGETLKRIKKYLNETQFESLHFTNNLGTDLKVGLVKNHRYIGGDSRDQRGIPFFANIPTEEIFTAPHRFKVDGHLVATKPLSYHGSLIEDFTLSFKAGLIVDYTARNGLEALKSIIETDEGSSYLGEISLVDNRSPLSQMDLLFYTTLFDENTGCHIGIGNAFPHNIENGAQLSEVELEEAGLNRSLTLVNITFGTADMKVIGLKNKGEEILIMEDGCFQI